MKKPHHLTRIISVFIFLTLSACGGGGGSGAAQDAPTVTLASLMSTLESTLHTMDTSYAVDPANPQVTGTISVYPYGADLPGFAFCEPSDLFVAPVPGLRSGVTSIYGCDNSLTLAYSNPTSSTLTVTLSIPSFYIDVQGVITIITDLNFEGYALATTVVATANFNMIDNGDGTYGIDTSSPPVVSITTGSLEALSNNTTLNAGIAGSGLDALIIDAYETNLSIELQAILSTYGDFTF